MDPILSALINNGGFALLAAVLYLLHTGAIKNFRDQQKEERLLFTTVLAEERARTNHWLDLKMKHHEEVMGAIRAIRCEAKLAPNRLG